MADESDNLLNALLRSWQPGACSDEDLLRIWQVVFASMKLNVVLSFVTEDELRKIAFSGGSEHMKLAIQFYEEAVWVMEDRETFPKPIVVLKYFFEKYKSQ